VELQVQPASQAAARGSARGSHRERAEAVRPERSHAKDMTEPAALPQASRPARARPAPALRCPRSKPAALAVQAEPAPPRIKGTEGKTATAPPSRAARRRGAVPLPAELATRAGRARLVRRSAARQPVRPAGQPLPAVCPGRGLATPAVPLPRSQPEAAAFPASQAEVERAAPRVPPAAAAVLRLLVASAPPRAPSGAA